VAQFSFGTVLFPARVRFEILGLRPARHVEVTVDCPSLSVPMVALEST